MVKALLVHEFGWSSALADYILTIFCVENTLSGSLAWIKASRTLFCPIREAKFTNFSDETF